MNWGWRVGRGVAVGMVVDGAEGWRVDGGRPAVEDRAGAALNWACCRALLAMVG